MNSAAWRASGTAQAPAPACLDSAADLDIQILESLPAMEKVREEWQELFGAALYRSLYGDPDYCLNWLAHFGQSRLASPKGSAAERNDRRPARPLLVLARNRGRLDVAMPLRLVPTRSRYLPSSPYPKFLGLMPVSSLEGLVNAHSNVSNILVRAGQEDFARAAIARAVGALRWQGINLGIFPGGHPFTDLVSSALDGVSAPVPAQPKKHPEMHFSGSFEEFLDRRPSLRKEMDGACRRLEREFGPISLEWWRGRDALEIGFPAFVEVDSESWKAREPGGEALSDTPLVRSYYQGLTEKFASRSQAHVWALRLGGKLAAADLTFESDGVLYDYKTSFKRIYVPRSRCRPGFVILSLIIKYGWNHFSGLTGMGGSMLGWSSTEANFERCLRVPHHPWRRLVGRGAGGELP